ncbi:hypothetical protein ACUNWD_17370 [Sunxiuqinia sp. A32]|uniref:hypothetical protein n=1 Tax=Sunxiuqinia sp. A32 TaxID=3461496 RepID=UPI0040465AE6
MSEQPPKNKSKIREGFLPGIIFPIIIFFVIYIVQYKEVSFWDYMQSMWQFQLMFKLLSLCVVPNLILFLYYFKQKKDMAARGVLMATFIYAFMVLISSIL